MNFNIPLIKPDFPDTAKLAKDLQEIVDNNYYTNSGPVEFKFSQALSKYVGGGVQTSVVANATLGLMLAIRALCNPSKKEMIIPSFTFIAGAQAILWNNYSPVLLDIDKNTFQPSIEDCRKYLASNNNVAGILLCNTFGIGNLEVGLWEELSRKYDVPLIIDSAAGFGSLYKEDELLGSRGDCEVFSFHATKPMGIGEAGAVVSKSGELIKKINYMKNFGFDESRSSQYLGLNAKLPEFSSSIGIRQLDNLSKNIDERRKILRQYMIELRKIKIEFIKNQENSTVAFVSCLLPKSGKTENVINSLNDVGIQARKYYSPSLHEQPSLKGKFTIIGDLTNTINCCRRIISLPAHSGVNTSVIEQISITIKKEMAI